MSDDLKVILMQGPIVDELIEDISEAIVTAIERGMEPIEVASTVATVAADYGRVVYGDAVIDRLKGTIEMRRGLPIEVQDVSDPSLAK